jgi:hypothetical protein
VIARVGVGELRRVLGIVARVYAAGISDVDVALLDVVTLASIGDAAVHGVLVVEAAASRVELKQLVAHIGV